MSGKSQQELEAENSELKLAIAKATSEPQERRVVLDHGYVSLVESWGSDERIIEAARMSTQKGFEGWGPVKKCSWCLKPESDKAPCGAGGDHVFQDGFRGDEKLLAYLWKNNHATPFEMAGAIIEVQAPIFVFREWHRHRTQSYNEMSARYAPLPAFDYLPTVERVLAGGGHLTKQAAGAPGADALTDGSAEEWIAALSQHYENAERLYQMGLAAGVPKELARLCLPVGRYSRMRASANLRNWFGFLTLREAPNAQWEIRRFANAVHTILQPCFPRSVALFEGK